jgi:hypothetical protein
LLGNVLISKSVEMVTKYTVGYSVPKNQESRIGWTDFESVKREASEGAFTDTPEVESPIVLNCIGNFGVARG